PACPVSRVVSVESMGRLAGALAEPGHKSRNRPAASRYGGKRRGLCFRLCPAKPACPVSRAVFMESMGRLAAAFS
ncbi:hypothetical protein, partial [Anaeromassilibacillus sp. An200]|uniref:hypothetical protein n=1 Tax=Anaeromassilibacillus sp. An200 TaxID=1965587 RepID=UPI0019D0C2E4